MALPARATVRPTLADVGEQARRAARRRHLLRILRRHAGCVARAATALGLTVPHTYRALRAAGLTLADVDALRPSERRQGHGC